MTDRDLSALPTASVVIPTFNRRYGVRKVVESVLADPDATEVVVVVDGCRDGTIEMLEDLSATEPRLRPMFVENCGEGRARQSGAEAAEGEVVVFLDDDVIPGPGLVRGHLEHHAAARELVVVGYMPVASPDRRRPGMFATTLYAREYEATCSRWESDPPSILLSLWAGNFSIRKADAIRVGLAAPVPLPYHEDMAFGLRCRDAGLVGVFDRTLLASHLHTPRPLDTFVSDARRQALGALAIHRDRSEGPYTFPDEEPFPRAVRHLIRLGAGTRSGATVRGALRGGISLTGRLHLFYLESYLAMVLRSSVQRDTILAVEARNIGAAHA